MTTVEVLTPWIERVVMQVLEADHLHRDPDGDIPITLDRTVMYVRFGEGPNGIPRVRLFGPLIKEIEASAGLYEKLNEVNTEATYFRFYLLDGVIWGSMELVAESFRPEDLANGLGAADFYSEHIGGLLGIPNAKPWRDQEPDPSEESNVSEQAAPAQNGRAKGLPTTETTGPTPRAAEPTAPLPDSAAAEAMNLHMGYL